MSTTIQAFGTLGVNDNASGTAAWVNPQNAGTATPTTCTLGALAVSQWLNVSGFVLAIPYGALIRGIQFDMDTQADTLSLLSEKQLQVMKVGARVGTVKDFGLTTWLLTVANKVIGSASELYAQTWFSWDTTNSAFGVSLQCQNVGALTGTISIKNVRATITYDDPIISTVASYMSLGGH